MDAATWGVVSIGLLLAANNAVVRVPILKDRALLFWAVQFMNLTGCVGLILVGLPGMDHFPAVNWMLGLLLCLHTAQNLRWRAERRRERAEDEEMEARKSSLRAALGEPDDQ